MRTYTNTCSVSGCENQYYAKGFCRFHYDRKRRNGGPLKIRKDTTASWMSARIHIEEVVLGYEGRDCLLWPFSRDKDGRAVISIKNRRKLVSRIACEAINGSPPTKKHMAAHSCGNGHLGCVNPQHLRWATHSENMADMIAHGTSPFGEKNPGSKLTESKIKEIRQLRCKKTLRELADIYGVHPNTIWLILSGRTWRHLT